MIFPNATVSVTRQDVVIYARLRVQINIYAGDSASGGRRGALEGGMSIVRNKDVQEEDIITILKLDFQKTPKINQFTAGVVADLGYPAPHSVVPLYGGVQQAP